jgi:hypothetical protein
MTGRWVDQAIHLFLVRGYRRTCVRGRWGGRPGLYEKLPMWAKKSRASESSERSSSASTGIAKRRRNKKTGDRGGCERGSVTSPRHGRMSLALTGNQSKTSYPSLNPPTSSEHRASEIGHECRAASNEQRAPSKRATSKRATGDQHQPPATGQRPQIGKTRHGNNSAKTIAIAYTSSTNH